VKGHPGSGKSTLLKYAMSQNQTTNMISLAFFFNGRGSPLEKSTSGLYRSLLHQLLQYDSPTKLEIAQLYKNRILSQGDYEKAWTWHEKELELWVKQILTSKSIPPLQVYIDALDEGGKEAAMKLVFYFQNIVRQKPEGSCSLHICLSCRHYPLIARTVDLEITVEDMNNDDIAQYTTTHFLNGGVRKKTAQLLQRAISTKANGIFQWAVIVIPRMIDMLQTGTRLERVQTIIQQLPKELDDLYHSIIQTVPSHERRRSFDWFKWICFATRPLSPDELRYAIIMQKDIPYKSLQQCKNDEEFIESNEALESRIKHFSRGLAEVRTLEETSHVQLIHQSVLEYLIESGLQLLNDQPVPDVVATAHLEMAWACVRYVEMEEIQAVEENEAIKESDRSSLARSHVYLRTSSQRTINVILKELEETYPLTHYTLQSWAIHAKYVEDHEKSSDEVLALIHYLSKPPEAFLHTWVYLAGFVDLNFKVQRGYTLMHVLANYDLAKSMSKFLAESEVEADTVDRAGRTPLSYAAALGNEAVVMLLVSRADVDPNLGDSTCGRSPLLYAAELSYAQTVTQRSLRTVQLLAAHNDVRLDARDDQGWTALAYAASSGNTAVVQWLMNQKGVNINSTDNYGSTPLARAAQGGHVEVLKLLLNRQDNSADQHDHRFCTPLAQAAMNGREETVRLLLMCKNVSADAIDREGRTPISYAAARGSEVVVQLLIQSARVEVDKKDFRGLTPLAHAARAGHEHVVRLLLSCEGVAQDSRDETGMTPLALAAKNGRVEVVRLLLLYVGIDVDSKDADSWTPFFHAAAGPHTEVMQLLLQTGLVNINQIDRSGMTPLMYAGRRDYLNTAEAFRLLLEYPGVEVNRQDNSGKSALTHAASGGNHEVVRMLLTRGDVQVNVRDARKQTPLMHAALWPRGVAVIKILLERDDIKINWQDANGQTALSIAAACRDSEAEVRALLGHSEVQADLKDDAGRTPLSYAAELGSTEVVKLLVQREDVKIHSKDRYGRTPLSYAVSGRFENIIQVLKARS
jgi:ankyrin repeat protein